MSHKRNGAPGSLSNWRFFLQFTEYFSRMEATTTARYPPKIPFSPCPLPPPLSPSEPIRPNETRGGRVSTVRVQCRWRKLLPILPPLSVAKRSRKSFGKQTTQKTGNSWRKRRGGNPHNYLLAVCSFLLIRKKWRREELRFHPKIIPTYSPAFHASVSFAMSKAKFCRHLWMNPPVESLQ